MTAMSPAQEYTKRLGPIEPAQFQAALDRFDLGEFVAVAVSAVMCTLWMQVGYYHWCSETCLFHIKRVALKPEWSADKMIRERSGK